MAIFVTIIHIIVCFILIAVILLQAGKGQGLAGASFGGGNVQSLLGTKGADFMTKATTVAAIGFMLTCLTLSFIETQKSKSLMQSSGPAAPIDVDQIKKALEKVKAETAAAEGQALEQAEAAAADIQQKAETLAGDAQQEAAAVTAEAANQAEALAGDLGKVAEQAPQI